MSVTVTLGHLHTVPAWEGRTGYCHKGARLWFARYGMNWEKFVRDGLPADVFEATGDAMAQRLVAWAREEDARG